MMLLMRITRRDRFLRVAFLASALFAAWMVPPCSFGQAGSDLEPAPEYEVKAAFLLNFSRYTDWPEKCFANASSPVVIGILGEDPFGDELLEKVFKGRTSNHRQVEVRRFRDIEEADGCHLVFISRSERHRQRDYLKHLAGKPILTVGESDGFLNAGGAINLLIIRDEFIQFEINLQAIRPVGLDISSRVLALAVKVLDPDKNQTKSKPAKQQALREELPTHHIPDLV